MYWKIHSPRPKRFPKGGDFAPRGPRDCPRAISVDLSFNITPVASGYQEIHPYSAMNIDSVKINTSLLMMREWLMDNTESEAGCRLCYRLRLKAEGQISDIQDSSYGNRQAANYQWESCKLLHVRLDWENPS